MPTATATYIFYNIIPAAATAAAASSTTSASTTTTTTTTRSLLKFIAIVFNNRTVDVFTQVRLFNLIYILLFWNLNYLE